MSKRSTDTNNCTLCKKSYLVGGRYGKPRASLFCSLLCSNKARAHIRELCIGDCGESVKANRKYCSRECWKKNIDRTQNLAEFICSKCATKFYRYPSQRARSEKVYCSGECRAAGRVYTRGEDHPQWKGGGRWVQQEGYIVVERHSVRQMEHRLVMAQHLGRPLERHETIHHINGDRTDNSIGNLQLRSGNHGKGVKLRCLDCGSANVKAATL